MRVCIFDMDGVLYRMDDPIPGAAETVAWLHERGAAVFYLTNNSSQTRADYVAKLGRMGIAATKDEVMTSAYALGRVFQRRGDAGRTVYVIGERGLTQELTDAGMRVVGYGEGPIDFVVSGWDRQFSYQKLAEAHLAIVAGAQFIATNRDATYPDAGGRTLPGSGALVAALETCSGVTPLTIGKPETVMLELVLEQCGARPEECLVVGDRLDTDIGIGRRVGTCTALVLTGVHTQADADAAPPDLRPDYVWPDLTYVRTAGF